MLNRNRTIRNLRQFQKLYWAEIAILSRPTIAYSFNFFTAKNLFNIRVYHEIENRKIPEFLKNYGTEGI